MRTGAPGSSSGRVWLNAVNVCPSGAVSVVRSDPPANRCSTSVAGSDQCPSGARLP